jgi:hypothetical protein
MTDVHEGYVEKRRWRIWPIVVLVLVSLLVIGILIAMIMNIHGSISWPAGYIGFGFPPKTVTAAPPPTIMIAPPAKVATDVAPAPAAAAPEEQQIQDAQPSRTEPSGAVTPPVESNAAAPADITPPEE